MATGSRDGEASLLEGRDITLNGFLDILSSFLPAFPLANASRQAGALCDPIAVLAGANHDLARFAFPSRLRANRHSTVLVEREFLRQ